MNLETIKFTRLVQDENGSYEFKKGQRPVCAEDFVSHPSLRNAQGRTPESISKYMTGRPKVDDWSNDSEYFKYIENYLSPRPTTLPEEQTARDCFDQLRAAEAQQERPTTIPPEDYVFKAKPLPLPRYSHERIYANVNGYPYAKRNIT